MPPDATDKPSVQEMRGDWRDIQAGIVAAYPDFYAKPGEERQALWGAALKFVAHYPPLFARCVQCNAQLPVRSMFRCTDCGAWLCENHWKAHFGPQHQAHP